MMINPEGYYEEYLKGKTATQIMTVIRGFKNEIDELEMEGAWPYECRKCIVGLEMLRKEENITRLELMEDLASSDMLIVDEAHHVINRNSKSHQIVEYFCESCDVAVFLSAAPLQLGSGDLFSLVSLPFVNPLPYQPCITMPNKHSMMQSRILSILHLEKDTANVLPS